MAETVDIEVCIVPWINAGNVCIAVHAASERISRTVPVRDVSNVAERIDDLGRLPGLVVGILRRRIDASGALPRDLRDVAA